MIARPMALHWTHPAFAEIATAMRDATGLVFTPNRMAPVEDALRGVMARVGLTEDGLAAALRTNDTVRQQVVAALTIGETYFFREPRQFDVVRDTILPALVDTRGPTRPLRMWSAGCASGEEPYSLSILLRETAWPHPARVLGTDLAASRLAVARRGRYSLWSFRGVPDTIMHRWFTQQRTQLVLDPSIRAATEFRVLNLAEDAYPSAASGVFGMDVIFCRNVLIYFDEATIAHVAKRLIAALSDDGWLLLGASDPPLGDLVDCTVMTTVAGIVYRRPESGLGSPPSRGRDSVVVGADVLPAFVPFTPDRHSSLDRLPDESAGTRGRGPAAVPTTLDPVPGYPGIHRGDDRETGNESRGDVVRQPDTPITESRVPSPDHRLPSPDDFYAKGDYDTAITLATQAIAQGDAGETPWIVRVRSLANQGRLDEAGEVCAAAIERHPLSVELAYLHAVLLAAARRSSDAATAARRALYLDRNLAVAHLLLGEHLARLGDRAGATRALDNAERLLAPLAADALVPMGDGATSARLLHVARTWRTRIAGSAA